MITKLQINKTLLCLAIGLVAGIANAEMTADEVGRLDKDLTPVGAERAGNKDSTIPAWTGGITKAPANFDINKGYVNPFAAEKPLYVITAANVDQYKDKLAPGQIELLKRYPTYKMNVYPSHRTSSLPQGLYDAIKTEGPKIKLTENGGLTNREKSTVPFPTPKNGLEVLSNHVLRYFGDSWTRSNAEIPVQSNGSFTPVTRTETILSPNALEGSDANRVFYYLGKITGPSSVAGEGILMHEVIDHAKESRSTWVYNPGSRRVLRAPQISHDSPGIGSDGLRTVDDRFGFFGSAERYNWKLVGKKEMIISYNNFRLSDRSLKYKDIIKPTNMNPDDIRYELHRVWVVEATLKPGMRHVYAKRTMYFDEDSWSLAHSDKYDGRGELWRVREMHNMPYYDAQMTWDIAHVMYDLQARRYVVTDMVNEERPMKFGQKYNLNNFTTDALRRQGN